MLPRHKSEMLTRLETLQELGACQIRIAELKRWYGRERLTKGVWVDLLENWEEISKGDGGIFIGQGDGIYTLIYSNGLTISDKSWWVDILDLAKQQ